MIMPRISPLLKRIYPKALEIDSHRIGLGKTRACAPPKPLQCLSHAPPKFFGGAEAHVLRMSLRRGDLFGLMVVRTNAFICFF